MIMCCDLILKLLISNLFWHLDHICQLCLNMHDLFFVDIVVLQAGRVIDEMWLIKDSHGPYDLTTY